MTKHTELHKAWSDVAAGDRVRFATPRFIKIGTVVRRKKQSIVIRFDGEERDTVLPDGEWYFVQGRQGNKEEHLVCVEAPRAAKTLMREPKQGDEVLSVSQAVGLFNIDAKSIRRWLRSGAVAGHQRNGTWLVEIASLGRHLSARR